MCYTVKKCWQGEETPGVTPCKHGQRIIVVHRCQPRWIFSQNPAKTTCNYFHGSCKMKKVLNLFTKRYENFEEKEKHVITRKR